VRNQLAVWTCVNLKKGYFTRWVLRRFSNSQGRDEKFYGAGERPVLEGITDAVFFVLVPLGYPVRTCRKIQFYAMKISFPLLILISLSGNRLTLFPLTTAEFCFPRTVGSKSTDVLFYPAFRFIRHSVLSDIPFYPAFRFIRHSVLSGVPDRNVPMRHDRQTYCYCSGAGVQGGSEANIHYTPISSKN
jgi:hypothetical protein